MSVPYPHFDYQRLDAVQSAYATWLQLQRKEEEAKTRRCEAELDLLHAMGVQSKQPGQSYVLPGGGVALSHETALAWVLDRVRPWLKAAEEAAS